MKVTETLLSSMLQQNPEERLTAYPRFFLMAPGLRTLKQIQLMAIDYFSLVAQSPSPVPAETLFQVDRNKVSTEHNALLSTCLHADEIGMAVPWWFLRLLLHSHLAHYWRFGGQSSTTFLLLWQALQSIKHLSPHPYPQNPTSYLFWWFQAN